MRGQNSGNGAGASIRLEIQHTFVPKPVINGKTVSQCLAICTFPKDAADKLKDYKRGWVVELEGHIKGLHSMVFSNSASLTIEIDDPKVISAVAHTAAP